jgi:DNA polymerase-1
MYTDRPGPHAFGGFNDLGYAAEDIHATKAVSSALHTKREPQHVDRMMWRAIPELVGMRYRGVYIDRPHLQELAKDFEGKVAKAEKKLVAEWGQEAAQINWNSNDAVVDLFRKNGIRLTETTDAGKYTVKESVLLGLVEDYPKVQTLLDFRAVQKTLTGFFQGYLEMTTPEHPFLHPDQDLRGAETGRTSMKRPNLQQVTRTGPSKTIFKSRWYRDDTGKVWNILDFIQRYGVQRTLREIAHGRLACAGKFGLIDLQQAELRAACLISNDMVMAQAIRSGDPHRYAASIAFHLKPEDVPADKRKKVKGVVFGKLYGGSSAGLAKRIGIGVSEVEEVDRAVFGAFKTLAAWLKQIKRFGVDNLYVEDVFGRRRDLSELMYFEGASSVARKACNTPIQALASHMAMTILTETSINCRTRGLLSAPLFGIHDSTLLDLHPDESELEIHACVQDAFYSLNYTPLKSLPMWEYLPIEGELVIGGGWAEVESTSDYYDKDNNHYFSCGTQIEPEAAVAAGRNVISLA